MLRTLAIAAAMITASPAIGQAYQNGMPITTSVQTEWVLMIAAVSLNGGSPNLAPQRFATKADCEALRDQIVKARGQGSMCFQAKVIAPAH